MADLDSPAELCHWDRHACLTRPTAIAAELAEQDGFPWAAHTLADMPVTRMDGAQILLEVPPELRGIGATACALVSALTDLRPILWQREQPAIPPAGPVVLLTALPVRFAAALPPACTPFAAAQTIDIGDQVRFHDHPVRTLAVLLDLFAQLCLPAIAHRLRPDFAAIWPADCTPDLPIAANPAKQLAVRLNDRIPIFWGTGPISGPITGPFAGIAADWCARRLWYADSMALSAEEPALARLLALGRLPRYWPNVATLVRLLGRGDDAASANLHKIFARRRFSVVDVAAPPELTLLEATYYLLALGEWVALYAAALTDADPLEQTPLLILYGDG